MWDVRIGISWRRKKINFQDMLTKQDLGSSQGLFSKLSAGTLILFVWEFPQGIKDTYSTGSTDIKVRFKGLTWKELDK